MRNCSELHQKVCHIHLPVIKRHHFYKIIFCHKCGIYLRAVFIQNTVYSLQTIVRALKEHSSILTSNWNTLLSMKANFQSLFKLNYCILFSSFDYIHLSFECLISRKIIFLCLLRLDITVFPFWVYYQINAASFKGDVWYCCSKMQHLFEGSI